MTDVVKSKADPQPIGRPSKYDPAYCHEERIPTEARQSMPMECMGAMTEWAVQHPKWRVVSWRCGVREEAI